MDIKKLNIEPVEQHVSGLIGFQIKFQKKFETNKHGEILLYLSTFELIGCTGIFQAALKSAKIETFSPLRLTIDGKNFRCSISIHFETKDGGTNGVSLCSCFFDIEKNKWEFK